jgi:GNAT superfamily N-acetyltransferase
MDIHIAKTDKENLACYPVMKELRPDIVEDSFVSRVRALEEYGYQLAYIRKSASPLAVAGFRIGESLAWGRYLYVDDLVALAACRSRGYGAALLSWLSERALQEGCEQLHLDCGVQREDAHRFYQREGMQMPAYHFVRLVE